MLAQRVATAALGIPAIVALVWIGGWTYAIVVAIVLAVAAAEFAHLRWPWRSMEVSGAALVVFIITLNAHSDGGVVVLGTAVGVGVAMTLTLIRWGASTTSPNGSTDTPGLSIGGAALYIGVLGSTIILLRDLGNGRDWVYLALFSTFAVDTCAYFTGRAIGRHKMAPAISPRKTWEGFAGGYAGGSAAVLLLNYFLGLRIDAAPALLIGAMLPAAASGGDLFESWIKRRAGVKDASGLIVGHGGVLDRLDSLLFTFPLVWVVARWIA